MREISVPSETLLIPPMSVGGISLVSGRGIITGFAIRESSNAAPADFDIIDGQTAGGMPMMPLSLDAHESFPQWFGLNGPSFENGLFVSVTAGSIRGAVFVMLEGAISLDGQRIMFGQSRSGAFVPVSTEMEMERGGY